MVALIIVSLAILASGQFDIPVAAQDKPEQAQGQTAAGVSEDAQQAEQEFHAKVERKIDALAAKARVEGLVRVIVHPRGDFKFSREMDEEQLGARQGRIAAARDSLATRMRSLARGGVKMYSHAPFVAFDVDEYGLQMLKSDPEVALVEEDIQFDPGLIQSAPLIGAPHAWSLGYSGAGQVIVIADTGVDKNHPFLVGKVVKELCFSTTSGTLQSACPNGLEEQEDDDAATPPPSTVTQYYHGTHVAGIAAGRQVTIGGIISFSGIARDAKIIAIQVFSKETSKTKCGDKPAPCLKANTSDLDAAALWVTSHTNEFEIAAMNMSLGSGKYSSACDSYDPNNPSLYSLGIQLGVLKSSGVAIVASSGNEIQKDGIGAPACLSSVISVGASSKYDSVAIFSNSAPILDLLAPGVGIYSSIPGGAYASLNGTSMAAPHVSGAIAVLRSKAPAADVDTLLNVLKTTGKTLTDQISQVKTPRINLGAAIDALCPSPTLSPSSITISSAGGAGQFNVSTGSYCSWKPTTNSPWIQIVSPTQPVTGSGTVKFKVSNWVGGIQQQRTGYIVVSGKNFKVTQIKPD
jgi:subtilisin family serine protease